MSLFLCCFSIWLLLTSHCIVIATTSQNETSTLKPCIGFNGSLRDGHTLVWSGQRSVFWLFSRRYLGVCSVSVSRGIVVLHDATRIVWRPVGEGSQTRLIIHFTTNPKSRTVLISWVPIQKEEPNCRWLLNVAHQNKTTAYSVDVNFSETGKGRGCVVWFDDGQHIYIRMAPQHREWKRETVVGIIVLVVTMCVFIILCHTIFLLFRELTRGGAGNEFSREREGGNQIWNEEGLDQLPLYDLNTLSAATNHFSEDNKIGQGGFGLVYKGVLQNGQEIAVKRLSMTSRQGIEEFKNEVILISNLQHRNLVNLLGCCVCGSERMLVYEYLPNKSLDYFIFNQSRSNLVTWRMRVNIIHGIARGILYLHQDSRLKIIHRDIKTSNILLDIDMTPKISDFGIAKAFIGGQTQEMTRRVFGTYGYMSPEYAMRGEFSAKSDVFSFGVLMLEIISGSMNWGFFRPDHDFNLLGHAWKLWNEGNAVEVVDPYMRCSFCVEEVRRYTQIGLLCVQQRADDRPMMSNVVAMLCNEGMVIPRPKEPGFCSEICNMGNAPESANVCTNSLTLSDIEAR